MQRKENFYEQRQTTLNDVGTRLKNLQSAAKDLSSVLTWASSQTVESSSSNQVAASLLSGSAPGGHQIAVSKLASADQWSFDFTSPAADTSITLTPEDPAKAPVSVQIAAGATIQSVADSINGASGSPAYAVVVGEKLVISSRTSGAAYGLTSVASGDGTTLAGGVLKAGRRRGVQRRRRPDPDVRLERRHQRRPRRAADAQVADRARRAGHRLRQRAGDRQGQGQGRRSSSSSSTTTRPSTSSARRRPRSASPAPRPTPTRSRACSTPTPASAACSAGCVTR